MKTLNNTGETFAQSESEALANMINAGTRDLRNTHLYELQQEHRKYFEEHGHEHEEVLHERSRLMQLHDREVSDKKSLDNVMASIQLSNDIENKQSEFKDIVHQQAYHLAVREFGGAKTLEYLKRYNNDPMTTLVRLRGYPDWATMMDEMAYDKKAYIENLQKQQ